MAQSANAAFNPAKKIGEQVIESAIRHQVWDRRTAIRRAIEIFPSYSCRSLRLSSTVIRIRFLVDSYSAP